MRIVGAKKSKYYDAALANFDSGVPNSGGRRGSDHEESRA